MTANRFQITAAAIVRNEALYIAEWIEYHSLIGVEHFYIYDNDSTDELALVLRPYLLDGRATLIVWPVFPGQIAANNHAVKVFGRDSEWMALIDIDEFLVVDGNVSLTAALAVMATDADQVLVPWLQFGSSGHEEKPETLVVESYVHRDARPHRQTKAIVRPQTVLWAGVHHCETSSGRTINGAGTPVPERWILDRPVNGPIRIHHYFTKSRAEFAAKIARGQAGGGRGKTLADFTRFVTDLRDDSLAVMGPAIREALARTSRRKLGTEATPFSAQSEIVPSRAWSLAVNEAIRSVLLIAAPSINALLSMDQMSASHQMFSDDLMEGFGAHVAATLLARELCSFEGQGTFDIAVDAAEDSLFGKVYTTCRVQADAAVELAFHVEGVDAAGKIWSHRYSPTVAAGETLLCFIQSPRTMRVDRLAIRCLQADIKLSVSGKIFSFL